jgi:tetrathionate reductase subunit B
MSEQQVPATATPKPVDAAPADANLVPLTELAPAITAASVSRRTFLGFGLAVAGGVVGAAAIGTLFPVFAEDGSGATPIIPNYDPASKQWVYVVDTAACIGCGLCVAACKEENKIPEEPQYTRTWIERHTTTTDGELYIDSPDGGIDGFPPDSTAPGAAGKEVESAFFMPRLCMQCANSPCTAVCPVGATYKTEDGVILVDARRCIGCGYCVVACPYGARYLVPAGELAPNGTPGVADKCTWCYHRISRGEQPACVEVCPVGARKFGDANEPGSEIAAIVAEQQPLPYRPEYGTEPRVLYLGPVTTEA